MASYLAILFVLVGLPDAARADEALWGLLQAGGQVAVIRHASTVPGFGDPPGFRLDDCSTQRNLSEAGREESRQIGAAFRKRSVPVERVLSSRWCRCLETARLAFGSAEPWAPLDSFFDDRSREPEQTRRVRALIGGRPPSGNLILVTHQVNITALTGISPAQGEMVILTPSEDGNFRVAGRLRPAGTMGKQGPLPDRSDLIREQDGDGASGHPVDHPREGTRTRTSFSGKTKPPIRAASSKG